ncbi:MAG: SDR family oxidoreductase [Oligoflexia bacterium]|nr:SDR family oxidoreductase [Oligoflexia bacterium]
MEKIFSKVLVIGGAGYVGSRLVPRLLEEGYSVRVFDLYIYGKNIFSPYKGSGRLEEIIGDVRNSEQVREAMQGVDAVIHLACISNDPSFELNPELGKSINFDSFEPLVDEAKKANVKRFIFASSSSVYGVKEEENVTEDLPLEPLTDYSKFKAMCEDVLLKKAEDKFTCLIVRPATVCGYAPRLRLDLSVNILTNHAVTNRKIKVFGGKQKRPNIHISDMVNFYLHSLIWPSEKIHKKIFNAGYENHTLDEIADLVKSVVGDDVSIVHEPTNDNRSYHVSSEKLKNELGFSATHSIADAAKDLLTAFNEGKVPNSMNDSAYYNIKKMQEIKLT